MMRSKRIRTGAVALAALVSLTGCDLGILDVENPNNLVEEDILDPTAANAVVNGALATVMRGIESMSLPYMVASDEVQWIGSRDAWGTLDQGNLSDPNNEFVDAAFPNLAEAAWMAGRAVTILSGHVENNPDEDSFKLGLARAYLVSGMIHSAIPQFMEDFVFSDKTDAGSPVGPASMGSLFDTSIQHLTEARTMAAALGDDVIQNRAIGWLAQTRHARSLWEKTNAGRPSDPLVSNASAVADAQALLARVSDDWSYNFTFSASTVGSSRGGQINNRGEQNFGNRFVTLNDGDPTKIASIDYQDPISGETDPRISGFINTFVEEGVYPSLPVSTAVEAMLIIAEDALARGDETTFGTYVNRARAVKGLPEWTGQISAMEMLQHERTAALFGMSRRLTDMYRFGITSDNWLSSSEAATAPGTYLPITCVEVRSNPNVESPRC